MTHSYIILDCYVKYSFSITSGICSTVDRIYEQFRMEAILINEGILFYL